MTPVSMDPEYGPWTRVSKMTPVFTGRVGYTGDQHGTWTRVSFLTAHGHGYVPSLTLEDFSLIFAFCWSRKWSTSLVVFVLIVERWTNWCLSQFCIEIIWYGRPAMHSIRWHYVFVLWFLSSFFFFLLLSFSPGLISAVGDWMSTVLPHMMWP